MEEFLPTLFLDVLSVSVIFSMILMVFIQKLKAMSLIKKPWQICIINFFFSFGVGVPFAIQFYNFDKIYSVWVGVFSFIGAPAIYETLKNQTLIKYKPSSLNDYVEIKSENVIKRDM